MLSQNNLKMDVIRTRYSRFRTWLLCTPRIWSRRMKQKQMGFFRAKQQQPQLRQDVIVFVLY